MTAKREYRIFKTEVRAGKDSKPQIEGYAAVFNTETDLGYVRESIAPGAFKRAIAENQDVRCLFNHDPNNILGRTKSGTLALEEDNTGLKFRCDMPDTTIGKDVHSMIMRGDVDQCSFGFIVRDEEIKYGNNGEGATRVIKDADLFDVSPVTYPAYPTTSVEARSNADALKSFRDDNPDNDEDGDAGSDHPYMGDEECGCCCRACYSAEHEECDMHMADGEQCSMSEHVDMRSKELREAKTKKVAGEDLGPGAFAYVGDKNDTSTWKLPIKFSSEEATKAHIRNALARFNQTKGIPADKKPEVLAKIKAAAKAHGIHVSGDSESNSLSLTLAKARVRQLEIEMSL